MSFDIWMSKDRDYKVDFSIGYAKWGLLDEIFEHKSFWFDNIDEKRVEDTIDILILAMSKLIKLPKEGVLPNGRVYTRSNHSSLIENLKYMIESSEENKGYFWNVSL